MDTLRSRAGLPPPSQIVVTFACGHGSRVSMDQRSAIQREVQAGLTCPACQQKQST
jgi:hypothetical protein